MMDQISPATLSIENDGKKDGRCSLNGLIGTIFSHLLEILQEKGFGLVTVNFSQIFILINEIQLFHHNNPDVLRLMFVT